MRLKDKVALITGGTSGIGEATALLFAKEGAKIAITGRNEKRGHAVIERILNDGGEAIFLRTDVRKADEWDRVADTVEEQAASGQRIRARALAAEQLLTAHASSKKAFAALEASSLLPRWRHSFYR